MKAFINCLVKLKIINNGNIAKYNIKLIDKFDIMNWIALHMQNEELNVKFMTEDDEHEFVLKTRIMNIMKDKKIKH